jgi:hypothetical protein
VNGVLVTVFRWSSASDSRLRQKDLLFTVARPDRAAVSCYRRAAGKSAFGFRRAVSISFFLVSFLLILLLDEFAD